MADQEKARTRPGRDTLRMWLTFSIAGIGILFVFLSFLMAVMVFDQHQNPAEIIVAVMGPVVAVVGTLAGYVAGQTAGAAGKEAAEERAVSAQDQATAAQQHAKSAEREARQLRSRIDDVRRRHPDFFSAAEEEASDEDSEEVDDEVVHDSQVDKATETPTLATPGDRPNPMAGTDQEEDDVDGSET